MRREWLKKVSVLTMALLVASQSLFGMTAYALPSDPVVAMPLAAYEETLDPTGKILAKALELTYAEVTPQVTLKVAAITKPKVEVMSQTLVKTIKDNEAFWESIMCLVPTLDALLAQIPPAPVLSMIPAAQLGAIKAQVQAQVATSIQQQFSSTSILVQDNVKIEMARLIPIMMEQIKPQIKLMVNDLGDMIDQEISTSIEKQIEAELGNLMASLPESTRKLGPVAIADMYAKKMMPIGESVMRDKMEAEMKAVITEQVYELIEVPMNQVVEARLATVNIETYTGIVDQIPESAFLLIPREFVKGIVDAEIQKLTSELPIIIQNHKTVMKNSITKEVDAFIDSSTKVYVNNVMTQLPFKIQKSKIFVKSFDLTKSLQIAVKYNEAKKTITMTQGKTTLILTIGSDKVFVNGKLSNEKLPPNLVPYLEGKTPMVPIEKIAPIFGMTIMSGKCWT